MTSKAIIFGVGLPMVIFGAFIALLIAPLAEGVVSTIEFVGSLIGILGVVFMISGMFYKKEIIITINNNIKEINQNNLQQIDVDEIKLSHKQKFTGKLNQLETKAKFLYSEAIGSNAALYYVEKALSIISDIRNNLDDSEGKITSKIKLIDQLLTKAEKIVQEST